MDGKQYATSQEKRGVAMYINNNLDFSDTSHSHFNTSNINIESQWISIKLNNNKPILIGNVYRPPQGDIDEFIHVLENIFQLTDLSKIEVYIMGDVNIDFKDKKHITTKKVLAFFKPYGFNQVIKEPTRYSTDKASLLDVFITNSNNIFNSGVCDVNVSDHQMILLTRKKIKIPKQKCSFKGRSYRKYDKNEFQQQLQNADWEPYNVEETITGKWNIVVKMINGILDLIKSYKIKQEKELWITPPLLELIKDKDNALRKAKCRKDDQLWKEAKRLSAPKDLGRPGRTILKKIWIIIKEIQKKSGKTYKIYYQVRNISQPYLLTYMITPTEMTRQLIL